MKGKVIESIPKFRLVVASMGHPSTFVLKKFELLDRTILSHNNILVNTLNYTILVYYNLGYNISKICIFRKFKY